MWTGKPELEFSLRILLVPWSWQSLFSNPQVLHIFHRAVVNPQGHSSSECLTPMLFSLTASSRELSWHPHPKWRNELDLINLITQASGKFTLQVRTPKPLQLQCLEIVHLSVGHGLMPFAIIWQKQKLSSKALAGEQKGCRCFFSPNTLFLNVVVCLLFFWVYTICSLIWDLKQFAIASRLWRSASRNETKELSQAVSITAANICRPCKWKNSGLSSGPSLGGLAAPGCSLAWALFFKSECRLNVRFSLLAICARKHQHHRLMFSKVAVKNCL